MSNYTSYLSNILTHTTSRYNSLRKILLSNEDDGDTEDDSHISRVLRAYYTEKGRAFPPWLPADPKDRRNQIQQQPQQSSSYFSNPLAGRNPYTNVQQSSISNSRGSGSLSDLWDAPNAAAAPAQSQSLRAGRRAPMGARPDNSALAVPQARPLPSQRAGSYQNAQAPPHLGALGQSGFSADPNPSPGGTAQDRLKARLWGRGGSQPNVSSNGQADPYAQQQSGNPYGQPPNSSNPYDQGAGSGSNSRRYGRMG